VVFDSDRDGVYHLWRIPASGGQPERLTDGEDGTARWSRDGKQIYFYRAIDGVNQVWALSVASRKTRPITALSGRRGAFNGLGLAADEKFIYFSWEEGGADIWVADIVEPKN
jgi:Tol biopolymer transport system component